jgi:hypothetical protein
LIKQRSGPVLVGGRNGLLSDQLLLEVAASSVDGVRCPEPIGDKPSNRSTLIVAALGGAVVIASLIGRVEKFEADLGKAQFYRLAERTLSRPGLRSARVRL